MEETLRQAMKGITLRLLQKLEQAVEELDLDIMAVSEKLKTEEGERVEKFQVVRPGGVVDRSGLRQITGVLKDLSELENLDLDTREQEARIARLCREAGLDTPEEETGVILLPDIQKE